MKSGIYLITNTISGKVYVGSSKKMWDRWRNHRSDLRAGKHTNCHLQAAWTRDGEDAFQFSVLEHCAVADLLEREDAWMAQFDCRNQDKGYNFWDARRHECSPETRAKIAEKSRNISPETRAKLSAARTGEKNHNFGKPMAEETKAKLSAAKKGTVATDEHRAKLSAAMKAREITWGDKISAAKMGHEVTAEARAKMSASHTGVGWSEAKRAAFEQRKADGRHAAASAKISETKRRKNSKTT